MNNISIKPPISKTWMAAVFLTAIILAAIWTGQNSLEDRVITVRYFLFALIALIAFLTPYVLFPDKNVPLLQLGNLSDFKIREYIMNKVLLLSAPVYLLILLMYFIDLQNPLGLIYEKFLLAVSGLILYNAILIFSVFRYLKSGESSQFWKEAVKGEKQLSFANYVKYHQVDPASLPSLLNTILVFSLGSASLLTGVYLGQMFTVYAELIFFLILMVTAIYLLAGKEDSTVRNFYLTDAFFREFFGVSMKGEEVAVAREVKQLWWVPARLKMHVWQFLLQLDRKVPAGRAVAAGHVAVWFIAYQRPDPQFLTINWILFAVCHQLFTIMTIQQDMAPHWLLRWVDKNNIWTLSRFWMQLRWIVPLLLSMNVQYFIFGVPGFNDQFMILSLYLLSALAASLFGTMKLKQDIKT